MSRLLLLKNNLYRLFSCTCIILIIVCNNYKASSQPADQIEINKRYKINQLLVAWENQSTWMIGLTRYNGYQNNYKKLNYRFMIAGGFDISYNKPNQLIPEFDVYGYNLRTGMNITWLILAIQPTLLYYYRNEDHFFIFRPMIGIDLRLIQFYWGPNISLLENAGTDGIGNFTVSFTLSPVIF